MDYDNDASTRPDKHQQQYDMAAIASQMQYNDLLNSLVKQVTDMRQDFKAQMERETADRKQFIELVHQLHLTVQKLESDLQTSQLHWEKELATCKERMRIDMFSEFKSHISSLKIEMLREIEKLDTRLEKYDTDRKNYEDKQRRLFEKLFARLEQLEQNQVKNSEWVELGKRILWVVIGLIVTAIMASIGIGVAKSGGG